jgi:hypothetical protein
MGRFDGQVKLIELTQGRVIWRMSMKHWYAYLEYWCRSECLIDRYNESNGHRMTPQESYRHLCSVRDLEQMRDKRL